jgi:tripartite-type tricarboxylate transporter receptor subunit TctC
MIDRRQLLMGAAGLAVAAPGLASAQAAYPSKPIQMIVAFGAGGGTDIAARSIARFMEKHLGGGASIGVVNRPGAGGEVGWTSLAQSPNDGYTIGFINAPAILAMTVEKETRFNIDSFEPIGNLVLDAAIIAVTGDSPYKTLKDFVEAARTGTAPITVGTTGAAGNSEHLALMSLSRLTGAKINHAPFGGTAPMRQALLGKHIPAGTIGLSEGLTEAREGSLRILGVMATERQAIAPDVPTFREQGIDLVSGSSRGIVAPKGIPADIAAKLRAAVKASMTDPEYVAAAQKASIPLHYLDGPDYSAFLRKSLDEMKAIWAANPWK